MFPQCGCAVRLGGMNEKKRWFIDDDVLVSLVYDFEVRKWTNGVMDERMSASSKIFMCRPAIEKPIPVLDLTNKTVLPKTPQP